MVRIKIVIADGASIEAGVIDLNIENSLYNGGSIAAKNAININAGQSVINENGAIKSGGLLSINANDIINQSSVNALAWLNGAGNPTASITSGNVYLNAADNIENTRASIVSNNFLSIIAGKDFLNQSAKSSFAAGQDRYSDLSAIAEVKSNGNLLISAGRSIQDYAGRISSAGDMYLTAQGDISFDAAALNNARFYGENGYAVTETTTVNRTSSLETRGNLIV
ncbi:MAG: hypothetical protein LBT81_05630 [Helicobacteraceae bacterium]|jgi:hypothetical protein|nr:hypothetical protein [Helicobacteraceae bacterium]